MQWRSDWLQWTMNGMVCTHTTISARIAKAACLSRARSIDGSGGDELSLRGLQLSISVFLFCRCAIPYNTHCCGQSYHSRASRYSVIWSRLGFAWQKKHPSVQFDSMWFVNHFMMIFVIPACMSDDSAHHDTLKHLLESRCSDSGLHSKCIHHQQHSCLLPEAFVVTTGQRKVHNIPVPLISLVVLYFSSHLILDGVARGWRGCQGFTRFFPTFRFFSRTCNYCTYIFTYSQ